MSFHVCADLRQRISLEFLKKTVGKETTEGASANNYIIGRNCWNITKQKEARREARVVY